MDQKLLKILGGNVNYYPHALESKYPRIFAKILLLWDEPEISDYFNGLMVSERADRAGFPPEVAAEIMRLNLVHAGTHKSNKKQDVWDVAANPSANRSNELNPLPSRIEKELEKIGIHGSAKGFIYAAETGNLPAIALFLEAHANTEIKNNLGWTPLMLAAFNGHNEVISTLIKHKANVQASDFQGNTALHWAIDAGQISSVKLLIENHAAVNARNNSGITPLFQATTRRRLGDVLLLIDSGANTNDATQDGSTALHKAASEGYSEIVRTLLHHDADINLKDNNGNTPLALAEKNDQTSAVKLLASNSKADNFNLDSLNPVG